MMTMMTIMRTRTMRTMKMRTTQIMPNQGSASKMPMILALPRRKARAEMDIKSSKKRMRMMMTLED